MHLLVWCEQFSSVKHVSFLIRLNMFRPSVNTKSHLLLVVSNFCANMFTQVVLWHLPI